jgi:hypothetical protein
MTTLLITKNEKQENLHCLEITDGKKTVFIAKTRWGVDVCQTSNASHRAWGGLGKRYASFEDAIKAYKSAFMRDAIELASTI